MTRIWFLDGTYINVENDQVHYWIMDGEVDWVERLYEMENGKMSVIDDLESNQL